MAKIKIDSKLHSRAKKAADTAGYSSLEEFVTYIIEREVSALETSSDGDEEVLKRLRGLGYIE